jgi:DNA-binding response OmpR family regulator
MDKMKIMVVDDEKRFLTTTKKLLEKKGVDVTIAECGADALEKLRDRQVHVVILDVKMPGMDGVATLRELKRLFPMVEVIMLTGHATMESAIEGLNAGAVDYLMKPTDPDEILDKAFNAFQRRMAIDEKIRMAKTLGSLGPDRKEPDNA